jgi:hypothetical protein
MSNVNYARAPWGWTKRTACGNARTHEQSLQQTRNRWSPGSLQYIKHLRVLVACCACIGDWLALVLQSSALLRPDSSHHRPLPAQEVQASVFR